MEAIVGLGIIEAFSYVLLYYTFIHSLNRYERKKDKIFYIAASLAVVVRLAAIVLDKEKTAVCMDIYLPCTILQTVLLLGMNVQTSNVFCRLSLGMSYIFYVFAARQAAAVFSYQFVKYSLHDELNTPSRMKIMTLSLTCVVTCILEIILVCAVYALMKKKKIQYASTTIFGAEVMVYCAAYIFRQQQRRMDMSAVTAGFIWIIIIIISLLFFGFQCQYSRLQELYAEKQQIQQELENTEYFYEKIQQGQDTIRNIRHDIHEHLLFVALGQRLFVLNFHAFNADFCKCADNDIFCFCFRFYCKTVPLHVIVSISLCYIINYYHPKICLTHSLLLCSYSHNAASHHIQSILIYPPTACFTYFFKKMSEYLVAVSFAVKSPRQFYQCDSGNGIHQIMLFKHLGRNNDQYCKNQ